MSSIVITDHLAYLQCHSTLNKCYAASYWFIVIIQYPWFHITLSFMTQVSYILFLSREVLLCFSFIVIVLQDHVSSAALGCGCFPRRMLHPLPQKCWEEDNSWRSRGVFGSSVCCCWSNFPPSVLHCRSWSCPFLGSRYYCFPFFLLHTYLCAVHFQTVSNLPSKPFLFVQGNILYRLFEYLYF